MRNGLLRVCLLVLVGSCASAREPSSAPPPAGPAGLSADSSIDQVLDALHDAGRDLKDFSADVSLTITDTITEDSVTRLGQVWFQNKAPGDARLRVVFDRKRTGTRTVDEKIEYLLDEGWLRDRDYRRKVQVNRQVLRPGQKINLLKLGEGPFPLPIGQDKDEVKKQFEVQRLAPAADDPPSTVHLTLKPLENSQFARRFSAIEVWVDTGNRFPVRIAALDRNGTEKKTTDLAGLKLNAGVAPDAFTMEKVDQKDWTIHDEPYSD